jgi:hypothetical protein
MNSTTIIISIITLISGFIIGKWSSFDILSLEKQTEDLEEMTDYLTEISADIGIQSINEMLVFDKYNSYIELLYAIEQENISETTQLILDNLGNFYYTYTHEERDMNSEEIETCLKEIERLSTNSELFKKVITYKPNQQ